MKIVVLIAAYRENPDQLKRAIEDATRVGVVLVVGDETTPAFLPGVAGARRGVYQRERAKRNALLDLAEAELTLERDDWFLSLDPDEKLLNGDVLREVLAKVPPDVPYYPIIRQEPDGRLWAMPCKLFRARDYDSDITPRYVYLDTQLVFGLSGWWDLDPRELGRGVLLPGWPGIMHLRSHRADATLMDDRFYSDDGVGLPATVPRGADWSTEPEGFTLLP